MSDYKRIVSYIYCYENGIKSGSVGFCKVEVKNGQGRLHISIKGVKQKNLSIYFYSWVDGNMVPFRAGKMETNGEAGEYKERFDAGSSEFTGAGGIFLGDNIDMLYAAEWDDIEINPSRITFAAPKKIIEAAQVPEEVKEEDELTAMINSKQKIDAFEDDVMYDCVEIDIMELKRLPISSADLERNTFVLHSYYNYHHLLFGRVENKNGIDKYFLGVPGTYGNRERFVAMMYGFENFRKSHRSGYEKEYFGYWYTLMSV